MSAGIGIKLSGAFCASANTASEYNASTTSIVRINWLPTEGIRQDSRSGGPVQWEASRVVSLLCSGGHLYDFLLNGESDQLRFVMDVEFAHEIELVGFHGLYAQT
jgi:hypothetical protein